MGDYLPPKRRDVFDRLRRRIELYRRHQSLSHSRSDPYLQKVWDQQRRETTLLHQRWQESKSKRTTKGTKRSNSDNQQNQSNSTSSEPPANPAGQGQSGPPALPAPGDPAAKIPKLDPGHPDQVYNFDESETHLPTNATSANNTHQGSTASSSQQIQNNFSLDIKLRGSQNSEIEVTLTSRVNTQTGEGGVNCPPGNTSASQTNTTSTRIETSTFTNILKQEPSKESDQDSTSAAAAAAQSPGSYPDSIGLEDVEEILKHIEEEDLLNVLNQGLRDVPDPLSPSKDSTDFAKDINNSVFSDHKKAPTVTQGGNTMFADPLFDPTGPGGTTPHYSGGQGAAPMVGGVTSRPPTAGAPSTAGAAPPGAHMPLGDAGPAAKYLQQMAQQHESQEQYNMKHMQPPAYASDGFPDGYNRRMPYYPSAGGPSYGNFGGYGQQAASGVHGMSNQMGGMPPAAAGATKPLTHYGDRVTGTSSSLQQLQNQVQSTFSQSSPHTPEAGPGGVPHMQITQSQHMQIGGTGGSTHNQRMQVSQTQQMHIQGSPAQISLAQQQSFKMSAAGGEMGPPNGVGPHYQQPMYGRDKVVTSQVSEGDMSHMQPYMNRPPPEYKMPPHGGPQQGYSNNPLQTMQNMVNQTNQPMPGPGPPHMYMKPDPMGQQGPSPPQPMGETPISSSCSVSSGLPTQSKSNGAPMGGGSRPSKASTPTYTSAIMRGQRAPNVNVGPEGLNISQQRTADWPPRMMGPGPPPMGMMGPQMGQHMRGGMGPQAMMQYQGGGYPGQPMGMQQQQGARMQMMQQQQTMQQQQGHMAPHMRPPYNGAPMGQMHHMNHVRMSQQQHMSMASQQQQPPNSMNMGPHSVPASCPGPMPSGPYPQQQQPPQQHQPPVSRNADFPALDFLDSGQGGSADLFDSVVQGANPSDFNFIDDIL